MKLDLECDCRWSDWLTIISITSDHSFALKHGNNRNDHRNKSFSVANSLIGNAYIATVDRQARATLTILTSLFTLGIAIGFLAVLTQCFDLLTSRATVLWVLADDGPSLRPGPLSLGSCTCRPSVCKFSLVESSLRGQCQQMSPFSALLSSAYSNLTSCPSEASVAIVGIHALICLHIK